MSASSTRMPGGMPSTTTPTPGPWDSPNVVIVNSCPNRDDTSALLPGLRLRRRDGLALELGDRLRAVGLVVHHQLLELEEIRRTDVGARLGDPLLAALPRHHVLAGVVEEQLAMHRAAIDQRAHHLPVGDRHP